MALDDCSNEKEAVVRFLKTGHLNVIDRKVLSRGKIKGSLIVAEICRRLDQNGYYPVQWNAVKNEAFEGGVIEALPDGQYALYWRGEAGLYQYNSSEGSIFKDKFLCVRSFSEQLYGKEFDGIPIEWKE